MTSSNRLTGLKARPKDHDLATERDVDRVGERLGFVDRSPRRKPGRKPSLRTFQLHPKVLPPIGEAFADLAAERGITQGQLFEEVWQVYLAHQL